MSENLAALKGLLAEKTGFDASYLDVSAMDPVLRGRMRALGFSAEDEYLHFAQRDGGEQEALINALVVPETWFFRDRAPFEFLKQYILREWMPDRAGGILRILSAPCSTGEEPYSIAMTLMDIMLPRGRFAIEAVDISQAAIERARAGLYTRRSFRESDLYFRRRFFQDEPGGCRLNDEVRACVRFHHASALEFAASSPAGAFDVVLCRNLLIYLNGEARRKLMAALDRALAPKGLFFLGHAEAPWVFLPDYEPVAHARSFAARKIARSRPELADPVAPHRAATAPTVFLPVVLDSPPAVPPSRPEASASPRAGPDVSAMLEEAWALANQGRYKEAEQVSSRILERSAVCAGAYYLLGVIAEAAHDEASALQCFNKTVYLDPDHLEALTHLSLIAEKNKHHDEAARYRRHAARVEARRPVSAGVEP